MNSKDAPGGGSQAHPLRQPLRINDTDDSQLYLPKIPGSVAECWDNTAEDDNSVWSRSTRLASMSWDWDDSPRFTDPRMASPGSVRHRARADSGCSSTSSSTSPPFCRPSCLTFTAGESARPEYSTPHSPRFFMSSRPFDVDGDELEGLLASLAESDEFAPHPSSHQIVRQEELLRRRVIGPPPNRSDPPSASRDVIWPSDLAQGEYDYQGIPWSRFSISRNDYRTKRVRDYSNYNNVNWNARLEVRRRQDITKITRVTSDMFMFHETFKSINPTIDHFQLRHLLWTTSNAASYYVSNSTLYEFNRQMRTSRRVLATNPQQMACCHVDHGLAASGSFDSEVKVVRLADMSTVLERKLSMEPNSITNHVAIMSPSRMVAANNDSHVSELDLQRPTDTLSKYRWTTAVNHVSVSPSGSVLCLVGDTCEVSLVDRKSSSLITNLKGHLDFSFCSSWSGDNLLCTGSQDGTCRVWDIRNPGTSLACLGSLLGAVRSANFSQDGRYLAFSEPADFVHVYDVKSGLRECQLLDFFGNISGLAFSPDSSKLSVSLADTMFGCLVDFQVGSLPLNTRKHSLDAF